MFTISILHLVGIIMASAFVGAMFGFFTGAILAMGGRCSDEEERRQWPGGIDR